MKFIYAIFALSAIVSSVSATPAPLRRFMKRDVNPSLIPQFGITAGVNPSGTGSCDGITGADGKPIQIPCDCPPNRDLFIEDLKANVAASVCINNTGVAVPAFPQDNSMQSQLTILHIATITLQNLEGPGKGCPQSSTNWSALAKTIQDNANSDPVATAATSPANSTDGSSTTCSAASS